MGWTKLDIIIDLYHRKNFDDYLKMETLIAINIISWYKVFM